MTQRLVMILLIVVTVFGGGFYAYQQLVPPPAQEANGPIYATKPITRGDISVGVDATGNLNPSNGGGIQAPGYEGGMMGSIGSFSFVVDEFFVKEGDEVTKGQPIAKLSSLDLKDKIKSVQDQIDSKRKSLANIMNISVDKLNWIDPAAGIALTAPIDGRVVGLEIKEGQTAKQGQIIAKVVDDSKFRLTAKLLQNEYANLKLGQTAVLKFPQFEGFVTAKIIDINSDPIPEKISDLTFTSSEGPNETSQFVYWVTIEGNNTGLFKPGMRVNVGVPKTVKDDGIIDFYNVNWFRFQAVIDSYVDEESVFSSTEAIATKVFVKEGQMVKKGTPITSLSGDDAQEKIEGYLDEIRNLENDLRSMKNLYEQLELISPMDGVVAHINNEPGRTLRPGEWLGHIYNTSDMRMNIQVDDVDVLLIRQGAPVDITLDALPGKVFKGEVKYVSTMGKDRDGITRFYVDISVEGGPELRPGMQAKAHIDAGSAENVLLIPLEAIFEEEGKPMVEILQDDNKIEVVSIQLGLMNHRYAEVKEGLEEGQLVVIGSTADLLPSQRIQSNDSLLPSGGKDRDNQNENGENGANTVEAKG